MTFPLLLYVFNFLQSCLAVYILLSPSACYVTSRRHSPSPTTPLAPVLFDWRLTEPRLVMAKNLVWFGEIERKLAKLSMTTFTYRSSSYLFYVFHGTDLFLHRSISTRRRICWLGTLCGVGACARSGRQQEGRRAGCTSGWGEPVPRAWRQGWKKTVFFLTSPVVFFAQKREFLGFF
jgi:hypothetical protein